MERNAAFDRCIDFLVRMMEKYSNEIVFPEEITEKYQECDRNKRIEEGRGDADAPAPVHKQLIRENMQKYRFLRLAYINFRS